MLNNARPLPLNKGVGFTTNEPLCNIPFGFRYENPNSHRHNYHFTPEYFKHVYNHYVEFWPTPAVAPAVVLDAFSPNLNKFLHVGHLRNLALAKSFQSLFNNGSSRFVSMLGMDGYKQECYEDTNKWLAFVDYVPELYTDKFVSNLFLHEAKSILVHGEGEYQGCMVYNGKKGPSVAIRSTGETTYTFHDLAFAHEVHPTHYLTGSEQKEHFENLGFGDKHLPMGLVLDPQSGKKMKSRDGNALSAKEALQMVIDQLDPTEHPEKLAWNILAWNFLQTSRSANVKFDVVNWTKPDQPGLYITYTFARLKSALQGVQNWDFTPEFNDTDVKLLGFCAYYEYWKQKAIDEFDPAALANYAHNLCRLVGSLYHTERIVNGRTGFIYAVDGAVQLLNKLMYELSMFPLTGV